MTGMATSGRIGLLVPSSNTTVEPEFYRALPESVTLHVMRLFLTRIEPASIQAIADELDRAAGLLATADVDVIVLGATAPSFLKGQGYDRELIGRIEAVTGKRATTTSTAMLRALGAIGARKVALGSAYTDEVNDIAAAFLEANGFAVTSRRGLGYVDNLAVGRLEAETAYDLGREVDSAEADAVLLACTNWQTMAVIDRLEGAIGKPVLSTSQVSVWDALRHLGHTAPVPGYGRLLAEMLSTPLQEA
jgi:maleate cis-trans isomerase